VAQYLNLTAEAEDYKNRSQWYKMSFDHRSEFFCPRKMNGDFDCPSWIGALNMFDKRYCEGDAWHYRFFVP